MSGGHSDDVVSAEDRREAVAEFLERTGAIGVLREVNPGQGSRFTDLNEKMDISTSTLSNRLDEATALQLLELDLESTDSGTKTLYKLTGAGARIRDQMRQQGIDRIYDKIRTLEEEQEANITQLQEWVSDEMYGQRRDRQRL